MILLGCSSLWWCRSGTDESWRGLTGLCWCPCDQWWCGLLGAWLEKALSHTTGFLHAAPTTRLSVHYQTFLCFSVLSHTNIHLLSKTINHSPINTIDSGEPPMAVKKNPSEFRIGPTFYYFSGMIKPCSLSIYYTTMFFLHLLYNHVRSIYYTTMFSLSIYLNCDVFLPYHLKFC